MRFTFNTLACKAMSTIALFAVGCMGALATVGVALADEAMPVAEQNALVRKYCGVCHSDAHMNGGLTLEHFDAAHADATVAAMLLSKLTNGLQLERVRAANIDAAAAAAIDTAMKTSAIRAAGVPAPDSATSRALVMALSTEAAGATEWTINEVQSLVTKGQVMTVSIIREATAANDSTTADIYRLTLTCQIDTREGETLLSWAPWTPKKDNVMTVVMDGTMPITYQVEGSEKMFKGTFGTMGTGATILNAKMENSGVSKFTMPLPKQTLTISNLFGTETVVFPFGDLPQASRQGLSTCFADKGARQ
jgi:hypothetical protein